MMFCLNKPCKEAVLVRIGSTIGATVLRGCPECYQVYWRKP